MFFSSFLVIFFWSEQLLIYVKKMYAVIKTSTLSPTERTMISASEMLP